MRAETGSPTTTVAPVREPLGALKMSAATRHEVNESASRGHSRGQPGMRPVERSFLPQRRSLSGHQSPPLFFPLLFCF